MSTHIERPRYQCALGGALVTINSIERAVAIVHAAPGCAASADGAATVGGGFGVIIGNANYTYALTRFISEDLGWIPYFAAVTDQLSDDQQAVIEKRLDTIPADFRPKLIFETDTDRITERLNEILDQENDPYGTPINPAFVIGSNLDRPLASGIKAGFWGVSYPITNRIVTDQFYVGFKGGLRLATDLISVLVANR